VIRLKTSPDQRNCNVLYIWSTYKAMLNKMREKATNSNYGPNFHCYNHPPEGDDKEENPKKENVNIPKAKTVD
jgi:hypothetical protein